MRRILAERRNVDAIFCAAGDATATGILAEAQARGVKVPEQIAVVGYDDSPLAAISTPPLTTVRQSAEKMAAEALRLVSLASGEILVAPRKVLLAPELVVRRSA
jgi:DNA-binding LacI/PurR family transcriptional regulator